MKPYNFGTFTVKVYQYISLLLKLLNKYATFFFARQNTIVHCVNGFYQEYSLYEIGRIIQYAIY